MTSSFTVGPSVSLAVKCSNGHTPSSNTPIYRPGDLIPAYTELHKHRSFEALSLHSSLIGQTRVWTHPNGREDIYQTLIHTHLNQSSGLSHSLSAINSVSAGKAAVVPITFVLPELVATGKDTSGRIPPSCESGNAYIDPWGRSYMQPLIEYCLQVTLRYRLPGETAVRTISAKHKIAITSAPHSDPPTYTPNIPEIKPVTASADIRRSRFAKPFARLRLSMAEPMPVTARSAAGSCQTTGQLRMTWETSGEAYDEFELGQRPVKIEYSLQARTRFGTKAIQPGWDDSKCSSEETKPHVRRETKLNGTLEVKASDRDSVRLIDSEDKRRSHTGTIPIPIQVGESTIPTFSHVLASRDYALLVKVQVQGMHHSPLVLKVPVQICESVAVRHDEDVRGKSSEYGEVLLSEVLPRYEDHVYSLVP